MVAPSATALEPGEELPIEGYQPVAESAHVPQQPYQRYFTQDALDRTITFYVSEPTTDQTLPLVAYVQGSGSGSLFRPRPGTDPERAVDGHGGHNTLADVVRDRARLLIVEKPGVSYLDAGREGPHSSQRFREEHTLERWAEAVGAALEATLALPGLDGSRVLVVGHSEGGIVASRVAADRELVTHVATLAGGGPTQLYDLVQLARSGHFLAWVSEDPEERVDYVLTSWVQIQSQPESTNDFFLGHPYRRWASFLANSTMEELAATEARILLIQGENDLVVAPETLTIAQAHLVSNGKDVTVRSIPEAGHSFDLPPEGEVPVDGWRKVLTLVVDWFLPHGDPR